MRRYIVTMLVIALLVGSLFKGADQTGVRLMKMFGTIGILLFGVVGTMALTRWQSREGLKAVETALKSLEPEHLVTDWAFRGGERPDYVLVGPGGVIAICLEEASQSLGMNSAQTRMKKGCERVRTAVHWVRDCLERAELGSSESLGCSMSDVPMGAVLVLLRRRVTPADSIGGVSVMNADDLTAFVRSFDRCTILDRSARVRLTRSLRQA